MVTSGCIRCGTRFEARPVHIKTGRAKFCSRICTNLAKAERAATTRECANCGVQIAATTAEARRRRYCSRACAMFARWSDRTGDDYRSITRPGHPLATARGTILEHRVVLYDAIGPGEHRCHWCDRRVVWAKGSGVGVLYVDHVDGNKQNNVRSNLVPSCAGCNAKRGMTTLIAADELFVVNKSGRRQRAVRRACQQCGADFLHRIVDQRPNVGRFCSRSCAAKWQMASYDAR